MEHNCLLLASPKPTPTAARRAVARGRSRSRRGSGTSVGSWNWPLRRATTASGEHTPGQGNRVIVRHFKIPGDPPRLRNPGDGFPGDRASLDIQDRIVPDLIHRTADLAGRIYVQVQDDRLATTSAAAPARFGSRSILLRLNSCQRRRNIVRLPLARQAGLSINARGRGQQ